ncbi:MAG: methionine gamma-lyase family protein [Bacilli bacterium]|nr:methionine gamma-lyase family protein [Bacilli bacterium]
MEIKDKAVELVNNAELELDSLFKEIDRLEEINSLKVLNAFHNAEISEAHFNSTTGYGFGDIGRDAIEKVFAEVLGAEDALVRNQMISGSHALTVCLFGLLRPGDTMLSISGLPYDTLHEVIGITDNPSSLKAWGVDYKQIDLVDNDFDIDAIKSCLENKKIKLIEIQRSKGYSTRKSLTIDKLERVIKAIREVDKEVIIMVDNCYCEFVETNTPLEVGADIMVGSLIKNLGGGIAPNGAYIAGRKDLVELASERLTVPGEGKDVGPTLGVNKSFLQGIYMAPEVVAASLKTAILTSKVLEDLGFDVEPRYNEKRADIVENVIFRDPEKLISYVGSIQEASAIDAHAKAVPTEMPGYEDLVIMASGSFTQGSSIEISCDGPIREPFIAYQQGGLTYKYGKIAIMNAVSKLID